MYVTAAIAFVVLVAWGLSRRFPWQTGWLCVGVVLTASFVSMLPA